MAVQAFVVEDNPAIRDSLVEALAELAGIETAGVAGTEPAAIAWLADPDHAWDIAVVDLGLGSGSGYGVLAASRNRRPDQKMVVLTGTATPQIRQRCEELGADGIFDKSLETEALLDYCAALARQKANETPHSPR